jgi:sporulation protein YlmC with PRC-barrel domain
LQDSSGAIYSFREGEIMSYLDQDIYGIYKKHNNDDGPGPEIMGADTLIGNDVYNRQEESLGDIKEIMLDVPSGRINYAVLSFGGFMGIGDKLFAVPWNALQLDNVNKRFILDIDKKRLTDAPGFDKAHWPNMADPSWVSDIHSYYGTTPYSDDK